MLLDVRRKQLDLLSTVSCLDSFVMSDKVDHYHGNFRVDKISLLKRLINFSLNVRCTIKSMALGINDGSWLHFKMATATGARKNVFN